MKVDYPLLQIHILKCKKPQTVVKTFITKIITEIFFIFWTLFDHLKENFLGGIYDHTNEVKNNYNSLVQMTVQEMREKESESDCVSVYE